MTRLPQAGITPSWWMLPYLWDGLMMIMTWDTLKGIVHCFAWWYCALAPWQSLHLEWINEVDKFWWWCLVEGAFAWWWDTFCWGDVNFRVRSTFLSHIWRILLRGSPFRRQHHPWRPFILHIWVKRGLILCFMIELAIFESQLVTYPTCNHILILCYF